MKPNGPRGGPGPAPHNLTLRPPPSLSGKQKAQYNFPFASAPLTADPNWGHERKPKRGQKATSLLAVQGLE